MSMSQPLRLNRREQGCCRALEAGRSVSISAAWLKKDIFPCRSTTMTPSSRLVRIFSQETWEGELSFPSWTFMVTAPVNKNHTRFTPARKQIKGVGSDSFCPEILHCVQDDNR